MNGFFCILYSAHSSCYALDTCSLWLNQWMLCVTCVMLWSSSDACFFLERGICHWLKPLILKLINQQCKLHFPHFLVLISLPCIPPSPLLHLSSPLWLLHRQGMTSCHPHLWKPRTKSTADDNYLSSPFSSLCPISLHFFTELFYWRALSSCICVLCICLMIHPI